MFTTTTVMEHPAADASPLLPPPGRPPVEYAVAVDRYLAAANLREASRRVYRIALATWSWALVDKDPPAGEARRGAPPPVVPLARLEAWDAERRLYQAFAARAAVTGARTANRELAILRAAISYWRSVGWIDSDPTVAIRRRPEPPDPSSGTLLVESDVQRIFALRAPLREQTLWHLVYETGAPLDQLLSLDIPDLAPDRSHARPTAARPALHWCPPTARLVTLLAAGRARGPLFLTDRRAPAGTAPSDLCPFTAHARLSYRRAAEVFTVATKPLTPGYRGWTLRQLQRR